MKLNVVAITGAGLSVDSGIRPYRGDTGVYTELEQQYGMPIEKLLTVQQFKKDPDTFWNYWATMHSAVGSVEPNTAHHALVRLSDKTNYLEITQNVDGLSKRAGILADELIELHGSAHSYRCFRCGIAHSVTVTSNMDTPRCTSCGMPEHAPIRPNIVMFGEMIKSEHYRTGTNRCRNADVLIVIGTTLQFGYLIDFIQAACLNDAVLIHVDPNADEFEPNSAVGHNPTFGIPMGAAAGVPLVVDAILSSTTKNEVIDVLKAIQCSIRIS